MSERKRAKPKRFDRLGRIAKPVRSDHVARDTIRRELGHWVSLHEKVEEHDFEWYTQGGRRFYDLKGSELESLAAVEQAIGREGLVESR